MSTTFKILGNSKWLISAVMHCYILIQIFINSDYIKIVAIIVRQYGHVGIIIGGIYVVVCLQKLKRVQQINRINCKKFTLRHF